MLGDLTDELLSNYDMLWMPSAFATTSYELYDHAISRDTILKDSELTAITKFIRRGGDLILDFGGSSSVDSAYDWVRVDNNSLKKMLAMLGVELYTTNVQEFTSLTLTTAENTSSLYGNLCQYFFNLGLSFLKSLQHLIAEDFLVNTFISSS